MTLAVSTPQRLSDLLAAEGYVGSCIGKFLELEDVHGLGDVYHGRSAEVDASNGRNLTQFTISSEGPAQAIDPGSIWLFSIGGGDIACTFMPY